jgi:hypothetical protein
MTKKFDLSEFKEFAKIPRLNRDIVITEKIDGTNACVMIDTFEGRHDVDPTSEYAVVYEDASDGSFTHLVRAGSKNRVLKIGEDNFGFCAWVHENAVDLALSLGSGHYHGEWYGRGIQRGYGLEDRRFALFNPNLAEKGRVPLCASVVPVLYTGPRISRDGRDMVEFALAQLRYAGSHAVRGFKNPEGVVIYHSASTNLYKATCENDASPKGA